MSRVDPSMEQRRWDHGKWLRGQFQNHQEDTCQIKKIREVSDRISSPLGPDFFKKHITKCNFKRVKLIAILVFRYLQVCFSNSQRSQNNWGLRPPFFPFF